MSSPKRKKKAPSAPLPSRTLLDDARQQSKAVPAALAFLTPKLPMEWQRYFSVRRTGKYWGLSIVCPVCSEVPPSKLLGAQRWRWLAVHIARHKPVKLAR